MGNNDDGKSELGHYSDHHYSRKCVVLLELLITTMKCKQASVNPHPKKYIEARVCLVHINNNVSCTVGLHHLVTGQGLASHLGRTTHTFVVADNRGEIYGKQNCRTADLPEENRRKQWTPATGLTDVSQKGPTSWLKQPIVDFVLSAFGSVSPQNLKEL